MQGIKPGAAATVRAKHVEHWPRAPGEYQLTGRASREGTFGMLFACPCGCGDVSWIDFHDDVEPRHPSWEWDGNPESPTLNPSLHKIAGCGWHGFLHDGLFQPC